MKERAPEAPDRNLALELVRVTEAAAMTAARWVGRGDKNGADGAAVKAIGQETFKLCDKYVDGMITVDNDEICARAASFDVR